ncbi:MAG: PucR family transcriptional regulator ligand-binding domain-containing protein [bacterium]|nr:PucR family transcriptional regulator ligand-binding domain-containing protein [bacterium]
MLTIAEALMLPPFEGARVVAGRRNLHRPVGYVHNGAVPEVANWLNGGELILTTAFNIPQDEQGRREYIRALDAKNVAGLIIAVGQRIEFAPPEMVEVAEAHGFPLIEIDYTARFVEMARSANEIIAQEQMALVTRALHIHKTLTNLVLEGGTIKQLATAMADLIKQSISIENDRFEALANANIGTVDEARRYTQQYGRTDPRLVNALEADIFPQIRNTLRPVFIPKMPHVGLEMERILAPIVVQGQIYGYLWVIADGRPLTDLDQLAIESGATIAALMLIHQESLQGAESALKGNILARLVQGEMSGINLLTDQALRFGLDLRKPFRAVVVDYNGAPSPQVVALNRRLTKAFNNAVIGQYAGQVMMLMQANEDLNAIAKRIFSEADTTPSPHGLRLGVSAVHVGAKQAQYAYSQCREVLHIATRLFPTDKIVYFEQLGYIHTLYLAGHNALNDNPLIPALRLLQEEQQADLFHTLEAYLDAGGNGVSTAEILHIHRSTLNYRLERIQEICDVKLSDPIARMNLQMALKLLKLFDVSP